MGLFVVSRGCNVSTDEVHHDQVEDCVGEQEVGERPLWRDGQELSFVLWVDLNTKTHWKRGDRIICTVTSRHV